MLNLKKLLTKILTRIKAIGTVYTAAWTAASNSASSTVLTGSINLPAGTYLLVVIAPTMSSELVTILTGHYLHLSSLGSAVTVFTTSGATATLRSAQSSSVTFSNIERGSLTAIRIA